MSLLFMTIIISDFETIFPLDVIYFIPDFYCRKELQERTGTHTQKQLVKFY